MKLCLLTTLVNYNLQGLQYNSDSLKPSPRPRTSGLYYKHMTIVNDNSSIISKWSSKLIDDARVIIYDRHMFIVEATELALLNLQRPKKNICCKIWFFEILTSLK